MATSIDIVSDSLITGSRGDFSGIIQNVNETSNIIGSYFFSTNDGMLANKEFKTGELGIALRNQKTEINIFINKQTGELFLSAEDSKNYSIDSNGNLIYTFR